MPDSRAGAHDLDVAGFGPPDVAETVLVRHRPFAHIRDDFHVRMRVGWKACAGRDLIVIPHAQRAPAWSRGIAVVGEGKMVLGLQPAVICACEIGIWSPFNHRRSPLKCRSSFLPTSTDVASN
jgi:hypothetical protein